jgi:hypothetical protein
MPAIDQCEPAIIRAFEKQGWKVKNHPFSIRIDEQERISHLYADFRLRSEDNTIIVVEVKCFPESASFLDEFYRAWGQYEVYRLALINAEMDFPLYLAVPLHIYQTNFHRSFVAQTMTTLNIKLVTLIQNKRRL